MTAYRVLSIIISVLMILCGIYCLFQPTATYMSIAGWFIGLTMLLDGCGLFCVWWEDRKYGLADGWTLMGAIVSVVLGIIVLCSGALQLGIDLFLIYFVSIWLIATGIFAIVRLVKVHNVVKHVPTTRLNNYCFTGIIIGGLMCLFGVIGCFNPQFMAASLGVFIGLSMIFSGASILTIATTPTE